MANKTYNYEVYWAWKDQGNRVAEGVEEVSATTVQRAISKAVKELNADDNGGYFQSTDEEYVRASDVLIIAVDNTNWEAKA